MMRRRTGTPVCWCYFNRDHGSATHHFASANVLHPSGERGSHCHLLMLASLPSTWIVACFAPDFTQVSQISSGWIGASVRHTCAPFSFHTPVTGIALSPAGVSAPDSLPRARA